MRYVLAAAVAAVLALPLAGAAHADKVVVIKHDRDRGFDRDRFDRDRFRHFDRRDHDRRIIIDRDHDRDRRPDRGY